MSVSHGRYDRGVGSSEIEKVISTIRFTGVGAASWGEAGAGSAA
jgi:hypothetical protein